MQWFSLMLFRALVSGFLGAAGVAFNFLWRFFKDDLLFLQLAIGFFYGQVIKQGVFILFLESYSIKQ
jgi:hypothetical protein